MVEDLPGYGTVWFHPNGIANILALVNVNKNHKVEYNSSNGNEFIVTKNYGSKKISKQSNKGLYYMETDENVTNVVVLSTIEKNKSKYTSRDYTQAKLARKLQVLIGRPEIKEFI